MICRYIPTAGTAVSRVFDSWPELFVCTYVGTVQVCLFNFSLSPHLSHALCVAYLCTPCLHDGNGLALFGDKFCTRVGTCCPCTRYLYSVHITTYGPIDLHRQVRDLLAACFFFFSFPQGNLTLAYLHRCLEKSL